MSLVIDQVLVSLVFAIQKLRVFGSWVIWAASIIVGHLVLNRNPTATYGVINIDGNRSTILAFFVVIDIQLHGTWSFTTIRVAD